MNDQTMKELIESLRFEFDERIDGLLEKWERSPAGNVEELRAENARLKEELRDVARAVRKHIG